MSSSGDREGPGDSPAPATIAQRDPTGSGERARIHESVRLPDDRLLFERVLATGGMGFVLQVYDLRLQRRVALKVLQAEFAQHHGERDAFLREARITAQLDHPNVVPVHELYVDDDAGQAGFIMKMVQGQSLQERLRELGDARLKEDELSFLLGVLAKVCDAVSFAHSRNLLHLDLKPSNIMIGSHGQVYVMDWGIAAKCVRDSDGRLRATEFQRGTRGTVAYMAPEQLDRELREVDERADVYALGGTLYEILTGCAPFEAVGTAEDFERKAGHVVPDPHADGAHPRPPPGLVQVALCALAPQPGDRYPSVDAFKAEIERLRQGGGWLGTRVFVPGDVIMREGDAGHEAYILAEGMCQVFKSVGGTKRLLRLLTVGDLFGEMAILTEGPRSATVIAQTEVKVWVLTRETLLRELGQQAWVAALVKSLADRFLEADEERAALRVQLEALRKS